MTRGVPPVHAIDKGDPKTNGPYLDDIRAEQERAYREMRNRNAIANEYGLTNADMEQHSLDEWLQIDAFLHPQEEVNNDPQSE